MICQRDSPLLVIMTPGHILDRPIQLRRDYVVVGREPTCDVWLDDPRVSRIHAALRRRGNAVYVQDLGSFGGTFVGGAAVTTARELHPGDVVSFANVTARFEPAGAAAEETLAGPLAAMARPAPDLRETAMTRTKARWLSWTGLLVLAEGFAIAALTKLSLVRDGGAIQDGNTGLAQYRLGPSLAGIPTGLLGWALAGVGFVLLVAGIGCHIAASSTRPQ